MDGGRTYFNIEFYIIFTNLATVGGRGDAHRQPWHVAAALSPTGPHRRRHGDHVHCYETWLVVSFYSLYFFATEKLILAFAI